MRCCAHTSRESFVLLSANCRTALHACVVTAGSVQVHGRLKGQLKVTDKDGTDFNECRAEVGFGIVNLKHLYLEFLQDSLLPLALRENC